MLHNSRKTEKHSTLQPPHAHAPEPPFPVTAAPRREKLKLSRKVGFREIRLHVEEEGYVEGINVGDPNKARGRTHFHPASNASAQPL